MQTLTLDPLTCASRAKLHALTGLRFFAALAVVFYHYSRDGFASAPVWILNLFSSGFIAVNLFFILSGFILAYTSLPAEALDKRKFYRSRFARIYPVYFQGLLLYAPFLIGIYLVELPVAGGAPSIRRRRARVSRAGASLDSLGGD